jgi:hypothetical protein
MIILVFNEVLYFGDHLKCTSYGVVVSDTPKQFDKILTHAIYVKGRRFVYSAGLKGHCFLL